MPISGMLFGDPPCDAAIALKPLNLEGAELARVERCGDALQQVINISQG